MSLKDYQSMKTRKPFPAKSIFFPSLVFVTAMVVTGCSGSSDSESSQIEPDNQSTEDFVDSSSGTNDSPNSDDMNSVPIVPVDDTENESIESPAVDSESSPVVSQPSPATIRVGFDITVPAYMSNELQVRLDWGDINTTAEFIRDESWSITEIFPSNTENLLTVTFADRNGGIILGTVGNTFRTGTGISEIVQITADQFNTDRWDSDNDGVSNLDELLAGRNPDGDDIPQPVQAALELVPDKTFRITWQTISNASFYRILENPDGVSGFSDISGQLNASTSSFDHRVTLYARVNAQYLVQSCNDQGCVDSEPVLVTGTLDTAIGYFKASNTDSKDRFGSAVSISADGNTLVVTAPLESSNARGINGDQNDNSATDMLRVDGAGAIYIFQRLDNTWQQQAYVKTSNSELGDGFGMTVTLSADGNLLAVGTPAEDSAARGSNSNQSDNSARFSGAVYVFERNNNNWQQQAYVKAEEDSFFFGWSVSLSGNGNAMAIGSRGLAYLFIRENDSWEQQTTISAGGGRVVALSSDGNTLAIGDRSDNNSATGINSTTQDSDAPSSGAVYVFTPVDGIWQQQAYIKASTSGFNPEGGDQFGSAIALSANGNTLVVGAHEEASPAQGIDGDEANNAFPDAGAAYVFLRDNGTWEQQAYLKASNTNRNYEFGIAVSLSADGKSLAVGSRFEKSVAVGINGEQFTESEFSSGAAYVFSESNGVWQQQAYLKPSNTEFASGFGEAISLSADGETLAVGASNEHSDATGINGNQANRSAAGAGAVYLY